MTMESSQMMMTRTGKTSRIRWAGEKVWRRLLLWYGLPSDFILVCWICEYIFCKRNISNDLIINQISQMTWLSKDLIIQKGINPQLSVWLSKVLIIKTKSSIIIPPKKILIGRLETEEYWSTFQSPSTSVTIGLTDSLQTWHELNWKCPCMANTRRIALRNWSRDSGMNDGKNTCWI
jgi:hypothetical protein